MNSNSYADTLTAMRVLRDERKPLEKRVSEINAELDKLMAKAIRYPESKVGVIGAACGFTPSYVSRKTGGAKASRAAVNEAKRAGVIGSTTEPAEPQPAKSPRRKSAAQKAADAVWGTAPAAPAPVVAEVPAEAARELPGIANDDVVRASAVSSVRRWTKQENRRTAVADRDGRLFFQNRAVRLDVGDGSVAAWLRALPVEVERLYFTGDRPWETGRTGTLVGDAAAWFGATPEGWHIDGRGHYTHKPTTPTGRWQHTETGRRVEFKHAAEWTGGECDAMPNVVWNAFRLVVEGIRRNFDPKSTGTVVLKGSPSQTGMDLWQRSIPDKTEYPVMSEELRELIGTTSGQGRFETRTPPTVPAKIPGLFQYDCTFAYAGLTWGLAVGAPTRVTGAQFAAAAGTDRLKMVKGRGRWHARVTVPRDWGHVGILPLSGAGADGGWGYPAEPGQTFTTWCGGPELLIAQEHGWHVDVIDGITWREGKPVNVWRDRLLDLWRGFGSMERTCSGTYADAAALARKMIRSIVLTTIGSWHARGPARSGIVDVSQADRIPTNALVVPTADGRSLSWQSPQQSRTSETSHPEWSAEIYSRMRARLLIGPQGTGVLTGYAQGKPLVTGAEVIAFRSDAVYTTRDLGWTNETEEPGRFRLKGATREALAAPMSADDLLGARA